MRLGCWLRQILQISSARLGRIEFRVGTTKEKKRPKALRCVEPVSISFSSMEAALWNLLQWPTEGGEVPRAHRLYTGSVVTVERGLGIRTPGGGCIRRRIEPQARWNVWTGFVGGLLLASGNGGAVCTTGAGPVPGATMKVSKLKRPVKSPTPVPLLSVWMSP
jgi:hypothetical protein